MKDFRGNLSQAVALGIVTMKQFVDKYNEVANSKDKVPVASVCNMLTGSDGCTRYSGDIEHQTEPEYDAVIFFTTKPNSNKTLNVGGKVVESKPLKMEL